MRAVTKSVSRSRWPVGITRRTSASAMLVTMTEAVSGSSSNSLLMSGGGEEMSGMDTRRPSSLRGVKISTATWLENSRTLVSASPQSHSRFRKVLASASAARPSVDLSSTSTHGATAGAASSPKASAKEDKSPLRSTIIEGTPLRAASSMMALPITVLPEPEPPQIKV